MGCFLASPIKLCSQYSITLSYEVCTQRAAGNSLPFQCWTVIPPSPGRLQCAFAKRVEKCCHAFGKYSCVEKISLDLSERPVMLRTRHPARRTSVSARKIQPVRLCAGVPRRPRRPRGRRQLCRHPGLGQRLPGPGQPGEQWRIRRPLQRFAVHPQLVHHVDLRRQGRFARREPPRRTNAGWDASVPAGGSVNVRLRATKGFLDRGARLRLQWPGERRQYPPGHASRHAAGHAADEQQRSVVIQRQQ